MFRTAEPVTSRYFASIVVDINEMLTERWSLQPVDGRTVLAAALAHADICWRRADPAAGVLLEIGLNPYNGRPCVNAWRDLLAGKANLVQPTPPPARVTRAQSAPPARILSRGRERAAADPSPMIGACGDDRGKSWARFSFPRPPRSAARRRHCPPRAGGRAGVGVARHLPASSGPPMRLAAILWAGRSNGTSRPSAPLLSLP